MLINGLGMKVFLAIGFVCFSMLCCFSQSVSENQLLWKITGKKLKKPSYIFGTFHSNDPRVFRFSDSTYNALMYADALVIEADMASLFSRTDTRLSKPYLMYDASGNPYTTNSKATKTRYGNEDGRPQFLDLYLQLLACNSGKKVFALESIEEQLHIFDLLKAQSKMPGASAVEAVSQEKIISAYIAGDITKIRDFLKYQLAKKKDAYQWIISDRNLVMVDGIDTLCKKNSLFIAIGAAHLSGPEGVINQLRERGYNVKQVKATFNSNGKQYYIEDSLQKFMNTMPNSQTSIFDLLKNELRESKKINTNLSAPVIQMKLKKNINVSRKNFKPKYRVNRGITSKLFDYDEHALSDNNHEYRKKHDSPKKYTLKSKQGNKYTRRNK